MLTNQAPDSQLVTGPQLRQLAAYIPATLADRILRHGLPTPGVPYALSAATLFSDISGFTRMSEELASDGPRGAEELNRVLLVTFTAMIDVIHEMGGAVNHFYGDAMSVYFPDFDGNAAQRALACAQMMQQLMLTSFSRVVTNRPTGKHPFFELTIKIGVGYGRCQELVVGDPEKSLEFVLTGEAVDEAAMAEHHASSGDIIASAAVMKKAGLPASDAFQKVKTAVSKPTTQPILNWDTYDEAAQNRLAKVILPFVPPALFRRLAATGETEMAEHRPVTTIFVQFDYKNRQEASSDIETAALGQQLQQYYEWACSVVSRFGQENARVNRVLTGDKGNQLHIMFGAPVAPDAPEQALRCLLALQREKPSFIKAQRMGVAVGKVFAGPVGSSSRREYTVVGDIVNLSARLMQVCEPGAILTDQLGAERTQQVIECEPLPTIHLKGKQTAVTPHLVQRDRAATTLMNAYTDRWKRPLIGREQEQDLLLGGMDAALKGVGGATAVYGGTGVGKSRLLATGVRHWLANDGLGLIGVSYPHTNDTPYSPWRDVWREYFGLTDGMSMAQQITVVTRQTVALLPDAQEDVGLWRELLGLPMPQAESLTELTAEARQVRLFTLVRRCMQAIAISQPLLVVLEGLQWADQATLALLDELGGHLEKTAVFLAFTFRSKEDLMLELLERPSCISIPLADLSPTSARQLLAQLVGTSELPQPVEQHLGMRDREGRDSPVNPLFLEEALKVMMGAGVLRVNGRVQVNEAKLARMQVPDTIHGLLLARLDRLPPAGRDLLQVASVIGRQFAAEPLQVIAESPAQKIVLSLLSELSESEMTRLISAAPEWIYLFQHALTHEVAYESLPFARRQKLHAAVANWLAAKYADNLKPLHPVLAYHHSRAANHRQALEYAVLAADEARNIFANREAIDLYNLAETHLKALDDDTLWETAVHLYLSRGNVLILLGDLATAFTDAEKALNLAQNKDDSEKLAQACNLLAELKCRQALFDDAFELTERIISDFQQDISDEEMARAYQWSGMAAAYSGQYDLGLERLEQAETLCLTYGGRGRLARVLEAKAFIYFSQKQLHLALQAMQESVDLSRNVSTPANLASSLNNIALVQFELGQPSNALDTFNEAGEFAQDTNQNLLAKVLGNRGEVLCYLGKYKQAKDSFLKSIDLYTQMNDRQGLADVYVLMGYEYSCTLHNLKEAEECFRNAFSLLDTPSESYSEIQLRLLIASGYLQILKGSIKEALEFLDQAEELIKQKENAWWHPVLLYYRSTVCQMMGEEDKARLYLHRAADLANDRGCPDYKPIIYLNLVELEVNRDKKLFYIEQTVNLAEQRARIQDRIKCFGMVGELLQNMEGGIMQEKSEEYKNLAQQLEASIEK
ncbi:MAG: adenylyl cyclase [Ardenticatenaceae bacterium]|nr:MAG: adenylyl cyclase [Ardenticatenaceae bacterium]